MLFLSTARVHGTRGYLCFAECFLGNFLKYTFYVHPRGSVWLKDESSWWLLYLEPYIFSQRQSAPFRGGYLWRRGNFVGDFPSYAYYFQQCGAHGFGEGALKHLPILLSLSSSRKRAHGLGEGLLELNLDYSLVLSSFISCALFGGIYLWHIASLTSIDSWIFCTILCLSHRGEGVG